MNYGNVRTPGTALRLTPHADENVPPLPLSYGCWWQSSKWKEPGPWDTTVTLTSLTPTGPSCSERDPYLGSQLQKKKKKSVHSLLLKSSREKYDMGVLLIDSISTIRYQVECEMSLIGPGSFALTKATKTCHLGDRLLAQSTTEAPCGYRVTSCHRVSHWLADFKL